MRDPLAPFIEGYDLSGVVNPYSFQCTPFYEEGDNGGTLMDGTTIHDVLAAKIRLSWTLNALSAQQYADLSAALRSDPSLDTVNAYMFDPTRNTVILARFHVSAPDWLYAFDAPAPMSFADSELVLEEAELIAWFIVTPPNKIAYGRGEPFDLTGLTVTQYDKNGNGVDITAQCTFSPSDGTELLTAGVVPVVVILPGGFEWAMDWNITVTPPVPIASGDWWTLYNDGLLDIYCVGNMPNFNSYSSTPWYQYRSKITSVAIGNSATTIGNNAFSACYNIAKITIPNSVTTIGNDALRGCYGLTSITIPNNVTTIGAYAFFSCQNLTSITIPDGVTTIEAATFYDCRSLTSITIPNGVTTIGNSAFSGCYNLTRIIIPNSVTTIGDYAFYGNRGFTNIRIPNSVTTIGGAAFRGCSGLTSITISNSITTIEHGMFIDCYNLTRIIIPNSVTTIGDYAFNGCRRLTHVYYSGTKKERSAIVIGVSNSSLTSATWHYNSTGPDS